MSVKKSGRTPRRPSSTPEGRESRLVSLAFDLAEKQLVAGTAASQVITQLLKLGTAREKLEREKIQNENLLLSAKVEQIAAAKRVEDLYDKAIAVMKVYTGQDPDGYFPD